MSSSRDVTAAIPKILLVDDEPTHLLALEAIIEPLDVDLVRATSGDLALRAALKDDFALILLDVSLPDMNGFAMAEWLRDQPGVHHAPVIFTTEIRSWTRAFLERGYAAGAVDYLIKPFEPHIVKAKVGVFVELARKNEIIRAQHETLRVMSERELAALRKQSDRRYADLADSVPLLVWITDAAGSLQYGNQRWEALTGGSRDFASVIAPADLPRFVDGWSAALSSGQEWEAELRFGNAEEGWRAHLVRVVPRRDESGLITSWVGTSTDIDARVRAERALRMLADASRRLGTLLEDPMEMEAVLRGALPILGDFAILELIDGGQTHERIKISGGDRPTSLLDDARFDLAPAAVARSGRPIIHLDVQQAVADDLASSRRTESLRFLAELDLAAYMCLPLVSRGRIVGSLMVARSGDGEPYAEVEVALAEDLARRIAVAVDNARLHDTTERRREELEQVNRSKDVFLATLSHELRTPLNAIVGWTDMILNRQIAPDELDHAVETIDRNAHALNHLVADLLDVSRIVTGSLKLDSRLVGLASVVELAIDAARPQCASKRLLLDVSVERVGCVRGDAGRLRQIVGNLLSNAMKFTPSGGRIVIRVARVGNDAEIIVADTGDGIAPELLPHVFERFRQAEAARSRGIGLGLAIVKHLVEEHGGSVTATSEGVDKGAVLVVTLPIAAEEAEADDSDTGRFSIAPPTPPQLGGVHVLLVEDDPDGSELMTTILERYGARVTATGTAARALEALDAELPSIVVSDIGLPDMSGIELIKQVRKRGAAMALPAIALTAFASRQDAAKAIAAGFDAHVAKPVQPGVLGAVVARLVARGRKVARPSSSQPAA